MEKEVNADLKKALSYIINSGYQLDKYVLDFLQKQDDPLKFIKNLIKKLDSSKKKELFISRDTLETTHRNRRRSNRCHHRDILVRQAHRRCTNTAVFHPRSKLLSYPNTKARSMTR